MFRTRVSLEGEQGVWEERLVVHGGLHADQQGSWNMLDDLWMFSFRTNAWRLLPEKACPCARAVGLGCAVVVLSP